MFRSPIKTLFILALFFLNSFVPSRGFAVCRTATEFKPCGWWAEFEGLIMWRKGRFYPPLASTGALDDPDTEILFGDEFIGKGPRAGFRFDGGIWLTRCVGGGGGFILLHGMKENFRGTPVQFPDLARPFFDITQPIGSQATFEPIAENGFLDIETTNNLWLMDLYLRYRPFRKGCWNTTLEGGFFYSRLVDSLSITNQSFDIGTIERFDYFSTVNNFYAGMIGITTEVTSKNFEISAFGKLGLGNMAKTTTIFGESAIFNPLGGEATIVEGGLLALPTNIGEHFNHQFEWVSVLGINARARVVGRLFLTLGYLYIFYPSVALAGNQVDLRINPEQLDGGPITEPLAPLFHLRNTSFWAQGIRAGVAIIF